MNNDLDTTSSVHIYKPKRWILALNTFSLLFIGIVIGIPFVVFLFMLISVFQSRSAFDAYTLAFSCLLVPFVILLGFIIVQMTISVILSFFSYVKISPEGLEQRQLIYKHIRCKWSDVDRLGKYFLFTDVIYLTSYEVIGPSLSLQFPFRLFRPKQGFLALIGFEGWPEGPLANDLRHYAPQLFENQPDFEETRLENIGVQGKEVPATDANQESRLLAALSHASVLFSSPGVIVPLVIYATQRKKSSYVGFQAFQAFIWQVTAFLFAILTAACMVGAIFIPVLLAATSQNARALNAFSVMMFVTMLASIFLMTFGSMAFVIYGLVGAIMTYRGKDFRYVLIGNRIEKSQGVKSTYGS